MIPHILLKNIARNTNHEELQEFCAQAGQVVRSVVDVNAETGRGYGVGFVTYASVTEAAEAAIVLAGKELKGVVPQIVVPTQEEVAHFVV